jgi:hypothetical protein
MKKQKIVTEGFVRRDEWPALVKDMLQNEEDVMYDILSSLKTVSPLWWPVPREIVRIIARQVESPALESIIQTSFTLVYNCQVFNSVLDVAPDFKANPDKVVRLVKVSAAEAPEVRPYIYMTVQFIVWKPTREVISQVVEEARRLVNLPPGFDLVAQGGCNIDGDADWSDLFLLDECMLDEIMAMQLPPVGRIFTLTEWYS